MRVSGEDAVMRSAEFDISSVAPQSPAPTSSSLSPQVFTTPQATRGPTSLSPSEPHAGSLSSQGSLFSPQAITSQEAFPATSLQPSPGSSAVHSSSQAGLSQASPQPAPQSQPERLLPFVSPSPTPHSTHSQSQEQPSQEVEMQDTMVEPMSPNLTIRVQFLTTNQVWRADCVLRVVGSLPQLDQWQHGCVMENRNGAWTYDMVLSGPYKTDTVIEFLYKYTAHTESGDSVWESRVSRCRLQLDKLLDHVFNPAHPSHSRTKVVFQANGIPICDESTDLIIAGSLPALGSWDLKNARGLRKATNGGTHHTTVFVPECSRFSYAYFLVRRMAVLFHNNLPRSIIASPEQEDAAAGPGILWGSGVGMLKVGVSEQACVQLLDEWEGNPDPAHGFTLQAHIPQATKTYMSQGNPTLPPPPDTPLMNPKVDLKTLKAKPAEELLILQQELTDRLQCKVCWERDVQCVFTPCGHSCACWDCAKKLKKCAVCRADISQRIKCYF